MSAHVLLNLLNELRKSDKMRVLSSILSVFSQRVFCSINHMTSKFHKNCISDVKIFCHMLRNDLMYVITQRYLIVVIDFIA